MSKIVAERRHAKHPAPVVMFKGLRKMNAASYFGYEVPLICNDVENPRCEFHDTKAVFEAGV
jgi:hypothetical protein